MQRHGNAIAASRAGQGLLHWTVMTCPRCGWPTLIETGAPNSPPRVGITIPNPSASKLEHLPEDVERYYDDAIRVLGAGVPDAAAVQLRKTLEAAAAHFEIDSGPLVQRIEQLIEQGLITNQFADVLQHVRRLGNVGAHASDERVDEEGARMGLQFTTQVLINLFEIPAQLESLKAETEPASS